MVEKKEKWKIGKLGFISFEHACFKGRHFVSWRHCFSGRQDVRQWRDNLFPSSSSFDSLLSKYSWQKFMNETFGSEAFRPTLTPKALRIQTDSSAAEQNDEDHILLRSVTFGGRDASRWTHNKHLLFLRETCDSGEAHVIDLWTPQSQSIKHRKTACVCTRSRQPASKDSKELEISKHQLCFHTNSSSPPCCIVSFYANSA